MNNVSMDYKQKSDKRNWIGNQILERTKAQGKKPQKLRVLSLTGGYFFKVDDEKLSALDVETPGN